MTRKINAQSESNFCKSLSPVGRILEDPEYNVWCCSPIYGPDGKVHVFYSRWLNKYDHLGWVAACEVAHAVAETPEGPYETVGVALTGSGGENWDSWSIHNPTVYEVDGKYILLYMGSNGSDLGITQEEIGKMTKEEYLPYFHKLVSTKRVGMAVSDSLYGPWKRVGNEPIIPIGHKGAWDDFCTSNPAFVVTPDNKYRIYYKGWDRVTAEKFNGNRKYGYAEAETLLGPYKKYEENPVIDFSNREERMQCEDAYVWYEERKYKVIMRDMGVYNHEFGLYIESKDGQNWGDPLIAYRDAPYYFNEPMPDLDRQGRFERPQLLMKNGKPEYLFCAYRGGEFKTSSGAILKLEKSS